MKTDHKSSPCHYVTGELKMYVFMHKRNVSLRQQKHMFEMKMIKILLWD